MVAASIHTVSRIIVLAMSTGHGGAEGLQEVLSTVEDRRCVQFRAWQFTRAPIDGPKVRSGHEALSHKVDTANRVECVWFAVL